MGINGLLPLLKSIQRPTQLAKFNGQTIGVDAYVWLHRGALTCAIQLAMGQPTTRYVDYAMKQVRMLQHFGVTPYIVFDGDALPSKLRTNQARRQRREEAYKAGQALMKVGKVAQANHEMLKAVSITHEMAGMFIRELKKANVKYIVAPYEADAQLAYLEKHGHIQAVLSEDSDLLVFGVKTLLTKLDQYGECLMLRREEFGSCREVSLVFWTDDLFRQMAILSGCDYTDNIQGMGLKTAHRLLQKHRTVERVLQAIRLEGKLKVPEGYAEEFKRAELTFLYQWAFCPEKQALVNLHAVGENPDFSQMPYIGERVEDQIAARVATGELHPGTKQPICLPQARQTTASTKNSASSVTQQENATSKKGVSITEFFKRRQPLAELDPNSFVLTTQQAELARTASNSTWTASLAEPRTLVSQTVAATVQAAEGGARLQRRLSTAPASPPNVKRQRLCQDDILPQEDQSGILLSSKYFGAVSRATEKRSTKKKSSGFEIFSDDSIDEAMASIPDPAIAEAAAQMANTNAEQADDESQHTLVDFEAVTTNHIFDDAEQTFVDDVPSSPARSNMKSLLDKFGMSAASSMLSTRSSKSKLAESPRSSSTRRGHRREVTPTREPLGAAYIHESILAANVDTAVQPPSALMTPRDVLKHFAVTPGSEDQLVETSESDDNDDRAVAKVLNIRQFAFSTAS